MNGAVDEGADRRRVYSNDELFDIIGVYFECQRNSLAAARQYALRYPNRRHPRRGYIHNLAQTLRQTGSFHPRQPGRLRRNPPAQVEEVRQRVVANPHTSTRAIARDLNSNKSTVHRIIKKYLRMKPWKRHTVHKLEEADHPRRIAFCEWIVDRVSIFFFK